MQVVGLPTGILFLGSASGKDSTCRHRRCKRHAFDPWVGKIPGGGNGNPLQYFLPGKIPWTEEPGGLQFMGSQTIESD